MSVETAVIKTHFEQSIITEPRLFKKKLTCYDYLKDNANIGEKKELAAKIDPPLSGTSIHDYFDNKNTQSMFLSQVTEEEVVRIVRTCNSKTSTDSNGISMVFLKPYNLFN